MNHARNLLKDTIEDEIQSISATITSLTKYDNGAFAEKATTMDEHYKVTLIISHLTKALSAAKEAYQILDEAETE